MTAGVDLIVRTKVIKKTIKASVKSFIIMTNHLMGAPPVPLTYREVASNRHTLQARTGTVVFDVSPFI